MHRISGLEKGREFFHQQHSVMEDPTQCLDVQSCEVLIMMSRVLIKFPAKIAFESVPGGKKNTVMV